jgi:carbonic anhydrase
MKYLPYLFERNRAWAERRVGADPEFFSRLVHLQRPDLLWIGCSDSRVPANQIVGLAPGELFVHRNVANVVPATDLNTLAVVEYAVNALGVRHVIVCGHYRCGGVKAALVGHQVGAVGLWLQPLRALAENHRVELDALTSEDARWDRLCELNVTAQVRTLAQTGVVETAWERGADLAVHGWIYDLEDGLLRDLEVTAGGPGAAGQGSAPRTGHPAATPDGAGLGLQGRR